MRDLMLRFASLGDNCEFGFAQEHYGSPAMDLFRWATTPAGVLLRLLEEDFAGIGENLRVIEHGRGFVIINDHYGFRWHDWTPQEKASIDGIAAREHRRLPAMAAKLRKEMRLGSRIFVIKQTVQLMPQALAARVHDAMCAFGRPVLLYVDQGGPVSVSQVRPGLLHGTIPEFANAGRVPSTTRAEDWLALCQATVRLVDGAEVDAASDSAIVPGADGRQDAATAQPAG